jgi:protein TonB
MFDLITGKVQHAPRHQATSVLVSIAIQVGIATAILAGTILYVATPVPREAMMMAFVAPPPPPPPPPPPKAPEPAQPASKPVPANPAAAPVEPPREIAPEAPPTRFDEEEFEGAPGGVVGGMAGGLEPLAPPPPPPLPPPAEPRGPIRVGGQIKEPALVYRVDPVYPGIAVSANIEGTVILEAVVDQEGRVESVKVLRSLTVLDKPAVDAVKQWRYSPVLLNGTPEKFVLTVAVTFRLEAKKG